MLRQQRLEKELKKLFETPPSGICIARKYDKLNVLDAAIVGPDNSPYSNGIFQLEIFIPDNYPYSPPSIRFLTKIYHPNVDDSGRVCCDLTQMPPKGEWTPSITLVGLLIAHRMLLETPNPDDPLMADIAEEFKNNNGEFQRKARLYTEQYAKK